MFIILAAGKVKPQKRSMKIMVVKLDNFDGIRDRLLIVGEVELG